MPDKTYIAIDLKSFYASVECRERGLDPMNTNLVVADESRTDKTICLAVTPSLKSFGIPGRAQLFEVKEKVREANAGRKQKAPGRQLKGSSHFFSELRADPALAVDFLIAPPRMAFYMEYSTRVYQVYMKYIAPEDVIVYSIDEVFMDVTNYLNTYKLTPRELAMRIILDVLETTGITATAGIGTNLYLAKIAMDIEAKHIPADENGVRIAELDEMGYRKSLWAHRPLTDFWRVGRGYARKLEENGMFTMGDIARCSIQNESFLYKLFGKNAELLIRRLTIAANHVVYADTIKRENRYEQIDLFTDYTALQAKREQEKAELERAAQFSPFQALTGYGAAIKETARLTDEKAELGEDDLSALNVKLRILMDHLEESPEVSFVCFRPDERKAGGSYVSVTGKVRKIDGIKGAIIFQNGEKIQIENIVNIEGKLFQTFMLVEK